MQHGERRSYRGSRLVKEFFIQFSYFNLHDTFKTGDVIILHLHRARLLHQRQQHQVKGKTRGREDRTESDTSPVNVSTNVDDRTGQPVVDQANQTPKTHKKEPTIELGDPL